MSMRNWREYVSRPGVRERANARRKAWGEFDRFKAAARRLARMAVQRGKLVRLPCEVCGTTEHIEAHHDDYTKPLSVRWLCTTHHREHHLAERRARRSAA